MHLFTEIEDFFTENECEFVIDLATAKGLKQIPFLTNSKIMFMDKKEEMFKMWNLNGDDFVDANEVKFTIIQTSIIVYSFIMQYSYFSFVRHHTELDHFVKRNETK